MRFLYLFPLDMKKAGLERIIVLGCVYAQLRDSLATKQLKLGLYLILKNIFLKHWTSDR